MPNILVKVCKTSTVPECLQPSSCHLGCRQPLVPTLPTPGGGGLWAISGNPGEKQMKLQISDTPKNGLQKQAYAGHMPSKLGYRSRDQAYARHFPGFWRWKKGGIFQDFGDGKRGAFSGHFCDTRKWKKRHIWGIYGAYAQNIKHMLSIC